MSAVRIEVDQQRTLQDGPVYRVKTQVEYAENIEPEIFVFNTETAEFSHVAVAFDMTEYPVSRDEAESEGKVFYRAIEATVEYPSVAVAAAAAAYTKLRIQQLASEYATANDSFVGSDKSTYTGGS
jgi:hypothetical protein